MLRGYSDRPEIRPIVTTLVIFGIKWDHPTYPVYNGMRLVSQGPANRAAQLSGIRSAVPGKSLQNGSALAETEPPGNLPGGGWLL